MSTINYNRLIELKRSINSHKATSEEKKEYMLLLFRNGNITKKQYEDFISNQNSDEIINAGLTIGGVLITAWLLSKLLGK